MVRLVLAFVVSVLYFTVGIYHVWKTKRKTGELQNAYVAYGAIWMVLGFAYLYAGIQQVLHELDRPLADRTLFYLTSTCAVGVIVPYSYFCSFLFWGDEALSRRLMALAAALFAAGTGLIWSTPVELAEFGWGSAWAFQGQRVEVYFQLVGVLPMLASLGGFMFLLYSQSGSKPARYRLAMTTLSIGLVLVAWGLLSTMTNASNVAALALSLVSGLAAHVAYYPPPFVRHRLGLA